MSFDAGNTLFFERPTRFEIYTRAAQELGLAVDEAAMRRAMHEAHDRTPPVDGEAARYTDRWFERYVPRVYRSLGATDGMMEGFVERLRERYRQTAVLQLFPEAREVIDRLRERGVRLAIVSNWSPRLAQHLDALGVTTLFDAVLISAIEGVEKPAPAIFERACARLGVAPGAMLHVGDHPVNDVEGARAAGVHGLLLDRDGLRPAGGIPTIPSLRGVLSWAGAQA